MQFSVFKLNGAVLRQFSKIKHLSFLHVCIIFMDEDLGHLNILVRNSDGPAVLGHIVVSMLDRKVVFFVSEISATPGYELFELFLSFRLKITTKSIEPIDDGLVYFYNGVAAFA